MTTPTPEVETPPLPPVKIAFVIDGEVVDILHTDNRLAAIFLSSPTVIDVTNDFGSGIIVPGSKYDKKTKTFTFPEPPMPTPVVEEPAPIEE